MSLPTGSHPGHAVVVAGFGTEYRHDDGVGIVVAERLAALVGDVSDIGPVIDPLDLLGRWDDADLAIVVDAVHSGASPGTLRLIELMPPSPPATAVRPEDHAGSDSVSAGSAVSREQRGSGVTSSHGIGLVGVVRLARAVGHAPKRVVVVGIEGDNFAQGTGLSPSVARAVPEAVDKVVRMIEEARRCV
jgi:hydrogenase maturation protease